MSTITQNEILRLVLITSFGKSAARPLKAAVLRLGLASFICIALSLMLARLISHIQLPDNLPSVMIAAFFSSITFVISGLSCLIFYSSTEDSKLTTHRILATLPIAKVTRIFIQIAPVIFICGLLILLLSPVAISVSNLMRVEYYIALASVVGGITAGGGMCLWRLPKLAIAKSLIFILISAGCFFILEQSIKRASANLSLLIFLILAMAASGYGQKTLANSFSRPPDTTSQVKFSFSSRFLKNWWFLLKIFRNRRSANALIVCLTIILATSAIIIEKHLQDLNGPIGMLIFAVTIAIAFACDIRGISRYYRPPEIFGLRGIGYFVKAEVTSTVLLSLIIGLPVLTALLYSSTGSSREILITFLGIQMFGGMIGLFGSTLFVPRAGEIGPQFFAAATSLGLFFIIQKLLKILEYQPKIQLLLWSLLGGVCIVLILMFENIRKSRYGGLGSLGKG